MPVTPRWYRLSVDVDQGGQPVGASWEHHVGDERVRLVVLSADELGPFDSPAEVLARVVADVAAQAGLQPPLFPS